MFWTLYEAGYRGKDWKALGMVTSVKNQKSCGSCWTFAGVGAVEAAYLIKYGVQKDLSEQSVLDCTIGSCSGGLSNYTMAYARDYGLDEEFNYPYLALKQVCLNTGMPKVSITSYSSIISQDMY